jgi:hypothetical protein
MMDIEAAEPKRIDAPPGPGDRLVIAWSGAAVTTESAATVLETASLFCATETHELPAGTGHVAALAALAERAGIISGDLAPSSQAARKVHTGAPLWTRGILDIAPEGDDLRGRWVRVASMDCAVFFFFFFFFFFFCFFFFFFCFFFFFFFFLFFSVFFFIFFFFFSSSFFFIDKFPQLSSLLLYPLPTSAPPSLR